MKKLIMTAAFAAFVLSLGAQSLNVSSAHEAMKRGYLKKAKTYIDAACEHEDTKDEAKTWLYKGLIYSQIGADNQSKKPKFKDLAPNWADEAYNAALECKRLDEKQEYAQKVNEVFGFVGQEYYNQAEAAYKEKDYTLALEKADKSVTAFNNAGRSNFAQNGLYVAGLSSVATKDTASVIKFFNQMTNKKTEINYVYTTLFNIYKAKKDNANAMKVATRYQKNCKKDYRAYLMVAEGYLLDNNIEKSKEQLNVVLDMTKDSADLYPMVLVLSADVLVNSGDFDGAIAKYNESLTLKPNQFEANFGLGGMYFNRAADKTNAANQLDPFDEEKLALIEKLESEAKDLYRQSISYLETAVAYIDALTDETAKTNMRANLFNVLGALEKAYAKVDMLNESAAVKARREQIAKQQ